MKFGDVVTYTFSPSVDNKEWGIVIKKNSNGLPVSYKVFDIADNRIYVDCKENGLIYTGQNVNCKLLKLIGIYDSE